MKIQDIIREEVKKVFNSIVLENIGKFIYLQEDKLEKKKIKEIDFGSADSSGSKPGIFRKFPKKEKGGTSLGMPINDGPHEFPDAK